MVYNVINKICDERKVDHELFSNSIRMRGDKILLYREKIVKEKKSRSSAMYEKYEEWRSTKDESTLDEIDDVIEKLRNYFKERLVVFYKCTSITT